MQIVKYQKQDFELDIAESNIVSKGLRTNIDGRLNLTIAFELSDPKLYEVDNPDSWLFNTFKTFKPDIFNGPFI